MTFERTVNLVDFAAWPKTPRLFRDITITEKIDGTNAAVIVELLGEDGIEWANNYAETYGGDNYVLVHDGTSFYAVAAQSRTRLVTPTADNFGFAAWVWGNALELAILLGPGRHFGEWWGQGIQRKYGLDHKRFSLFNTFRYEYVLDNEHADSLNVGLVPVLYQGPNEESAIRKTLDSLWFNGSSAAEGFPDPEGLIVFHTASRQTYKVLIENDDQPKGLAA